MGKDAVETFFKTLEKEGLKKAEITSKDQSYRYIDGEIWEKSSAKGETVDLYNAANQFKAKGETRKAITLLEVLLQTQPDHLNGKKLLEELRHKQRIDSKTGRYYSDAPAGKRRISKLTVILLAIIGVMAGFIVFQWINRPGTNTEPNEIENLSSDTTIMVKEEKPDPNPVSDLIKQKAYSVKKNDKGFWEAVFFNDTVMIYIPPGKFIMGSNKGKGNEKPAHEVYLDGYWIGKYEVTSSAYPKYNVTWHEADNYCKRLSQITGLNFKLPTEAQWEKAARGSYGRKYPWGNHAPYFNRKYYANYEASGNELTGYGDGYQGIAPVGSFPGGASPYGCMDMAGNVWEWCQDFYGSKYYEISSKKREKNPTGPPGGPNDKRVFRGGGWDSTEDGIRCTYRGRNYRMFISESLGFRVAMTEKKDKKSSH